MDLETEISAVRYTNLSGIVYKLNNNPWYSGRRLCLIRMMRRFTSMSGNKKMIIIIQVLVRKEKIKIIIEV